MWFIPLATEATSIGIVADATLHPFHTINRFERALAWLWAHEPQCAQAIEAARGQLRDFRVLKRYAYTCTQVFSVERWCLTGEAGVFADPLYSPGTDFIALGNCFITDLIVRERQGENITQRTQVYNQLFLKLFTSFLSLYEGQYPVMGNSQVMVAKIAWDFAIYWGIIALVFFHQKFCDLAFILTMRRTLQRVHHLNVRMQKFFQVWDTCEHRTWSGTFIDIKDIQVLHGWHRDLRTQHSDAALQAQIAHNLTILEAMAAAMVQYATACMPPDVRRAECVWWLSGEMDALLQSAQEHPEVGADLAHLWLARVAEPLRHGDKGYEV